MQQRRFFANALVLAGIYGLLLPSPALAYWDLNFGTYLLQLAFAFGATAWISLRHSWKKGWGKKAGADADAPTTEESK